MSIRSSGFPALYSAMDQTDKKSPEGHKTLDASVTAKSMSATDGMSTKDVTGNLLVPCRDAYAMQFHDFVDTKTKLAKDKPYFKVDSHVYDVTNNLNDVGKKRKKKETDIHEPKREAELGDTDGKAPGLSYIALISMAIQSSRHKRMLLSEIYQWIAERYPYYQMKDKSWRNSIRHNLSLNECFVKCGRSENGKGNYWGIHPANIGDFANGDFRRRRARRQVRKCDEELHRLCSNSPEQLESTSTVSTKPSTNCSTDKYVPMASSIVPGNFLSTLGFDNMKSFEYWLPNHYTSSDYGAKFHAQSVYNGQHDASVSEIPCPNAYPLYGFQCNPCRTSVSSTSTPDPLVNVNVNVNVCGGDPSQYQSHPVEFYPLQYSESLGLRSRDATLL
ncbi:hypothetical protein ACF0H5_013382 [Mactra antiquata]